MQLQTLIKKIRKSTILRAKLKKVCELENVKFLVPKIGIEIRWNSTYDAIERALKLKKVLKIVSLEKPVLKYKLEEEEWVILEELYSILKVNKNNNIKIIFN